MGKTTYVLHCGSCKVFVELSKKGIGGCPPKPTGELEVPMYNLSTLRGTEYGERKDGSKPYFDEMLDTHIYSKSHKEEVLKQRGLRQVDSGARKKKKSPLYFT